MKQNQLCYAEKSPTIMRNCSLFPKGSSDALFWYITF